MSEIMLSGTTTNEMIGCLKRIAELEAQISTQTEDYRPAWLDGQKRIAELEAQLAEDERVAQVTTEQFLERIDNLTKSVKELRQALALQASKDAEIARSQMDQFKDQTGMPADAFRGWIQQCADAILSAADQSALAEVRELQRKAARYDYWRDQERARRGDMVTNEKIDAERDSAIDAARGKT